MTTELLIAVFAGINAMASVGVYFRLGKVETRLDFHEKKLFHIRGS